VRLQGIHVHPVKTRTVDLEFVFEDEVVKENKPVVKCQLAAGDDIEDVVKKVEFALGRIQEIAKEGE